MHETYQKKYRILPIFLTAGPGSRSIQGILRLPGMKVKWSGKSKRVSIGNEVTETLDSVMIT